MPSGQTHSTVTALSSVGLALFPIDHSVALAVGCMSGMILSPDLDHDSGSISYEFIRKIGGGIIESWWHGIWRPYQLALKHRSFWSHFPAVSTLVRILYLFFPLIINAVKDQDSTRDLKVGALSIRSQLLVLPMWLLIPLMWQYADFALWFVIGLAISDFWHWLFDSLF